VIGDRTLAWLGIPRKSRVNHAERKVNFNDSEVIHVRPSTYAPETYSLRPTGPKISIFSTSDSHFYFFNGLFGGSKEPNRRGFIEIGPYKPLKRAPKDDFF